VDSLYWHTRRFSNAAGTAGCAARRQRSIYAVRRSCFTGIRSDTIVDDFVIPLVTRLRCGSTILYDETAVAYEETPADFGSEFRRRSRIGAGGFQSLNTLWRLLGPRYGWLAFSFLSHKVLRWMCPFLMIGALSTNLVLAGDPLYLLTLIGQVLGYGLSALGLARGTRAAPRVLRLATMFTTMNAALLGFLALGVRWPARRLAADGEVRPCAWRFLVMRTSGCRVSSRHDVGNRACGSGRSCFVLYRRPFPGTHALVSGRARAGGHGRTTAKARRTVPGCRRPPAARFFRQKYRREHLDIGVSV
jgi:hypothetical protein